MSTTNQNFQSAQAATLTQPSELPNLPNSSDSNPANEAPETNPLLDFVKSLPTGTKLVGMSNSRTGEYKPL